MVLQGKTRLILHLHLTYITYNGFNAPTHGKNIINKRKRRDF